MKSFIETSMGDLYALDELVALRMEYNEGKKELSLIGVSKSRISASLIGAKGTISDYEYIIICSTDTKEVKERYKEIKSMMTIY